jgi:hypothetical protein
MRDNQDFVFTARCAADAPVLRGVTADEIATDEGDSLVDGGGD